MPQVHPQENPSGMMRNKATQEEPSGMMLNKGQRGSAEQHQWPKTSRTVTSVLREQHLWPKTRSTVTSVLRSAKRQMHLNGSQERSLEKNDRKPVNGNINSLAQCANCQSTKAIVFMPLIHPIIAMHQLKAPDRPPGLLTNVESAPRTDEACQKMLIIGNKLVQHNAP
jgi:hypothetical protein